MFTISVLVLLTITNISADYYQITPDTCGCPKVLYEPVCGNDNITYSSNCMLECKQSQSSPGTLYLAYEGECKDLRNSLLDLSICKCNRLYRPVCGTDGNMYNNPCMLNCARKYNPNLTVAKYETCRLRQFTTLNEEDNIPCICNKLYLPVCATDGNTYSNPCRLECASRSKPGLKIQYEGPCKGMYEEEEAEEIGAANLCICSFDYKPICGTNGRTYTNLCMLKCMAKEYRDIKIAYEGECNNDVCICNKNYEPVCGSDAITYGNICELKCAKKFKEDLSKRHDGKCTEKDITCGCEKSINSPICGSDGSTYNNTCLFHCAQTNNPQLIKLHADNCNEGDSVQLDDPYEDLCSCTTEYKPVCGTDSKTYSNICILNCMKNAIPDITLAYEGECDLKRSCICKKLYDPMCGSNGKTFSNVCELECDQKWNPELKRAYNGECKKNQKPICVCKRRDKPTCGNDGTTYASPCILGCEQSNYPGLTIAHFGPCSS